MSIGFLILRLVVGLTLAAHGAQKLSSLSQTAAAFEQLGFVPGRRSALLAGLAETGAGLLLALGPFTPGAAGIAVAGLVLAGGGARAPKGVFSPHGGRGGTPELWDPGLGPPVSPARALS